MNKQNQSYRASRARRGSAGNNGASLPDSPAFPGNTGEPPPPGWVGAAGGAVGGGGMDDVPLATRTLMENLRALAEEDERGILPGGSFDCFSSQKDSDELWHTPGD
jgi:hypothetical protein